MVKIMFVGNVDPQSTAVIRELSPFPNRIVTERQYLERAASTYLPDLIIVAGWRHLIPPQVLAIPPLGTVGFHSAKLPEYPGRAPVPWTLIRQDRFAYNTMLYLDEGVDSGDIIDQRSLRLVGSDTPATLYEWMAKSAAAMTRKHLPRLLDGTAPRRPQDMSKRGRETRKDGWNVYYELERMKQGHA